MQPRESAGHEAVFERLFRAEYARVVGVAFQTIRDRQEAEDVAQEAFIRFHERYPPDASFAAAWLCRTAANIGLTRLRSRRRREHRELDHVRGARYQLLDLGKYWKPGSSAVWSEPRFGGSLQRKPAFWRCGTAASAISKSRPHSRSDPTRWIRCCAEPRRRSRRSLIVRHLSDGLLRLSVDEPGLVSEEQRVHLRECMACQGRRRETSGGAGRVGRLLVDHAPYVDAHVGPASPLRKARPEAVRRARPLAAAASVLRRRPAVVLAATLAVLSAGAISGLA